MPNMLEPIKKY